MESTRCESHTVRRQRAIGSLMLVTLIGRGGEGELRVRRRRPRGRHSAARRAGGVLGIGEAREEPPRGKRRHPAQEGAHERHQEGGRARGREGQRRVAHGGGDGDGQVGARPTQGKMPGQGCPGRLRPSSEEAVGGSTSPPRGGRTRLRGPRLRGWFPEGPEEGRRTLPGLLRSPRAAESCRADVAVARHVRVARLCRHAKEVSRTCRGRGCSAAKYGRAVRLDKVAEPDVDGERAAARGALLGARRSRGDGGAHARTRTAEARGVERA